jgi:hypothetical protein
MLRDSRARGSIVNNILLVNEGQLSQDKEMSYATTVQQNKKGR